jgi:hypothetical protein
LSMNGRDGEFLTTTVIVGIITGLTYMGLIG